MEQEELITTLKNAWNQPSKKLIRHELTKLIEILKQEKIISSNLPVIKSVCLHLITYVDDNNFQKCQQCNEIVD
jgi:hypothetical protein